MPPVFEYPCVPYIPKIVDVLLCGENFDSLFFQDIFGLFIIPDLK